MNYPKCKTDKCSFVNEGGRSTLLYSPLRYNKDGQPIGGGANKVGIRLRCQTCDKEFYSIQTEFDDATGKDREWEESND